MFLNKTQRLALHVIAILIALMLVFPPYTIVYRGETFASGYAFFLALPTTVPGLEGPFAATVHVATLLAQIFGAAVIALLVVWANKGGPDA